MKHFSCSLEMIGNLVEHSDGYFFIQDGLADAFLQFVHVFLQSLSVASFVFEMGPREFEVIPGKFHETWPIVPAGFAKAVKPVRTLQWPRSKQTKEKMNIDTQWAKIHRKKTEMHEITSTKKR